MTELPASLERPLVFTIAFGGYAYRFAGCIASQRSYASRHGYSFVVVSEASFSPRGHEAAWLKLLLLRHAVQTHGVVAFIDSDCRVSPDTPRFESCFTPGASMCIALGLSGRVNSGVMFANRGAVGRLDAMIGGMMQAVPEEHQAPYENGHVIHYTRQWDELVLLSQAWNNTNDESLKDYIRHYCGGEGLRRVYRPTLRERFGWGGYRKMDALKRRMGLKEFSTDQLDKTVQRLFDDVMRVYPMFGDSGCTARS